MSGKLSRRGGAVDPFIVMDVMAAAAEKEAAGDSVIHLEVGQPSTPAPKGALAAADAAVERDRIGYVAELGRPAPLESSDQANVVNSFSKSFSRTGGRVGWLVVPPDLVRPIERLTQNFFISVPTLSQHAALAAFECREELDGHVRR